jgi:AbrB family looped-hinge helix DNA binding protein
MIKRIDKYNRIIIPKEMQKLIGVTSGQAVNIEFDNDKITIKQTTETFRMYLVKELKKFNQRLDNANTKEEQILFNGLLIELEQLLNKYDELY